MTATNHMLTGALVGAVIREPLVALPTALISHFLLDALPHFGFSSWQERVRHKKLLQIVLSVDGLTLAGVCMAIIFMSSGWLIFACGLVAVSPDLVWVYRFVISEKFGKLEPQKGNWLTKFHTGIQKREFPNGYFIEFVVFVMLFLMFLKVIKI